MNLLPGDPSFISALLATSLKGSMLILLVGLIQWLGRERIPPAWRYALWLLVVIRLVLPAGPESRFSVFNVLQAPNGELKEVETGLAIAPHSSSRGEAIVPAERNSGGAEFPAAGTLAVALWGLGTLLLLLRASRRTRALAMRIESEQRKPADPAQDLAAARVLLERSRRRMKIRREVGLVETSSVDAPALHGIVHPRILLPAGLLSRFESDELEYIFLHELAHLRRHDVALNVLTWVVQSIHWFNPLVWLAFSRMREERELACDELALAVLRQDERPRYGRTILKLLESFHSTSRVPALVGITNHRDQMKRRITMIATFQKHSRKSMAFAALVVMIGAVSLTEAQQEAPDVRVRVARAPEALRMLKQHAPEATATLQRLEQKITLDLPNVSVEDVFHAVSNQTGVRVSLAPELVPSMGTLDRLTIKAANVPAHMTLVHAAASLGLAVEFQADGVTVSKSDESHPRVMVLRGDGKKVKLRKEIVAAASSHPRRVVVVELTGDEAEIREGRTIDVSPEVHGGADTVEGDAGRRKVMVHMLRRPDGAATGHAPASVEEVERIITSDAPADGTSPRVHMLAPHAAEAGGKTSLEINTKDESGAVTKGTLEIEVHSDEARM